MIKEKKEIYFKETWRTLKLRRNKKENRFHKEKKKVYKNQKKQNAYRKR